MILLFSSCEREFPFKIGNNYYIDYGNIGSYRDLTNNKGSIIIDIDVTRYAEDSTFIVIEQKPYWEIVNYYQQKQTDTSRFPHNINKLIKDSDLYYYWIINQSEQAVFSSEKKKTTNNGWSNVYGPYTKDEMFQVCKEKGIPLQLFLEMRIVSR